MIDFIFKDFNLKNFIFNSIKLQAQKNRLDDCPNGFKTIYSFFYIFSTVPFFGLNGLNHLYSF